MTLRTAKVIDEESGAKSVGDPQTVVTATIIDSEYPKKYPENKCVFCNDNDDEDGDDVANRRCTWTNFCRQRVNYRAIKSKNSSHACFSVNTWFGLLTVNCIVGLLCVNGFFSLASLNSALSIGSVNSVLSIGSLNSVLSVGCLKSSFGKICTGAPGSKICAAYDISGTDYTFAKHDIAGYYCRGGTYNGYDSNKNNDLTKESCETGGGQFNQYSCKDFESYMRNWIKKDGMDETEEQNFIDNYLQSKCCIV